MGSAMAQTGLDFPKPKGLLPGGQSDSRFPVSFAAPVTEGLRLVIEYFTALNQRDVAGIAKTLHFPFAIYENIEPLVYQNEAEFLRNPQIGRAHVCTPVTNAHIVCRLLLEKNTYNDNQNTIH